MQISHLPIYKNQNRTIFTWCCFFELSGRYLNFFLAGNTGGGVVTTDEKSRKRTQWNKITRTTDNNVRNMDICTEQESLEKSISSSLVFCAIQGSPSTNAWAQSSSEKRKKKIIKKKKKKIKRETNTVCGGHISAGYEWCAFLAALLLLRLYTSETCVSDIIPACTSTK